MLYCPAIGQYMKTYTFHDDNDRPIVVRYDFDEGEEQWFDAKAGVGSPGYEASVEICEVLLPGCDWMSSDAPLPQVNLSAMRQEILDYELGLMANEEADHYESLERGYAQDRL